METKGAIKKAMLITEWAMEFKFLCPRCVFLQMISATPTISTAKRQN